MKKLFNYGSTLAIIGAMLIMQSCGKDDPAPAPDARFNTAQDADDPLKWTFTNESLNATTNAWDFGDGTTLDSNESSIEHTYAQGGKYTVSLTVKGDGGEDTRTEEIEAINPIEKLTGTDAAGKSWKMVRQGKGMILGPTGDLSTEWWSFGEGGVSSFASRFCIMTDEYIFRPDGKFEFKANGSFYASEPWGPTRQFTCLDENASGAWMSDSGGDLSAWAPAVHDFTYDNDNGILDLIGMGAKMGLFKVGTDSVVNFPQSHVDYSVTQLEDVENGVDTLRITAQYVKADGTDVSWYYTYVSYDNPNDEPALELPKPSVSFSVDIVDKTVTFTNNTNYADTYAWDFGDGTSSSEENPADKTYVDGSYTITLTCTNDQGESVKTKDISIGLPPVTELNIGFESDAPTWITFGGAITEEVIANPDASGINTSAMTLKVNKAASGIEGWAGLSTTLAGKVDFTSKQVIKVKVYSTAVGQRFLLKLEDSADGNIKESHELPSTVAGSWEELTFTFDAANTGKFDKLVLFPDFYGAAVDRDIYIDDITF